MRYVILIMFLMISCGDKKKLNMVDFRQINDDKSSNYFYIFQDEIEKETREKADYYRKNFSDNEPVFDEE